MKAKTLTKLMAITVISTLTIAKAANANEDPRKQSNLWIGKEQTEAKTIKATKPVAVVRKVEKKPVVKDTPDVDFQPEANPSAPKTAPMKQTEPKPAVEPVTTPITEPKPTPKKVEAKKETPKPKAAPKKVTPPKAAPKKADVEEAGDDEDPFHMKDADKSGNVFKLFGK
jgi:hypothetical protein